MNRIFLQTLNMDIKNAEFQADFESVEKVAETFMRKKLKTKK